MDNLTYIIDNWLKENYPDLGYAISNSSSNDTIEWIDLVSDDDDESYSYSIVIDNDDIKLWITRWYLEKPIEEKIIFNISACDPEFFEKLTHCLTSISQI